MGRYDLITAPAIEPIDVNDLYSQARIDSTAEVFLLDMYIKSARQYVEAMVGPIITQTWDLTLNGFPAGNTIQIEKPRVTSVTSLKYTDEDATEHTFYSSKYVADYSGSGYSRIVLKDDYTWPTDTLLESGALKIRFVAGYANAAAVPVQIKHAIMLLAAHYDANRLPANFRSMDIQTVPYSVKALLAQLGDYHV